MKAAVFPSDDGGCGWYRLRWPAEQLARQGHDVEVAEKVTGTWHQRQVRNTETGVIRLATDLTSVEVDADVVVMQRVTRDVGVEFARQAKDQGLRLVVDVDDDLDALHDGHPYIDVLNSEGRHPDNLHAVCDIADLVTVTTPALAERYAPHGRVAILPNLVPSSYLRMRARRSGPLRVGWTGRPQSHVGDHRALGRIGATVDGWGARFAAWGQSAGETHRVLGVPARARVTVPFRPLRSGYPGSVAELSVGLVPLQDTAFNRAKSWLKGIEYAALGVPFVASPLPEYVKLAELGAGLLASTPEEWAAQVERLLGDEALRADLAASGREVAAALTYEAHAGRWWSAWTDMSTPHEGCATLIEEGRGALTASA